MRRLIRILAGCILDSEAATFLHSDNEDSDYTADAQADLNLRWPHMSEGTFTDVTAQMCLHCCNSNGPLWPLPYPSC